MTFCSLNWVDLATHKRLHKYILVFKCLNNLIPVYLSDYFVRNHSIHTFNTRSKNDLHLSCKELLDTLDHYFTIPVQVK